VVSLLNTNKTKFLYFYDYEHILHDSTYFAETIICSSHVFSIIAGTKVFVHRTCLDSQRFSFCTFFSII
jgi:hypothetical protein